METNNSGSEVVALQVKVNTFLEDSVDLKKLDKELSKASKAAVDVLLDMLESTDAKLKMQAAVKLLELGIDVKKAISTDQMQRMIAEIKLSGVSGSKTLELESGRSNRPIVNFSEIRSID